jgi:DNA invertase Pin-like site-specific DNA recombinase
MVSVQSRSIRYSTDLGDCSSQGVEFVSINEKFDTSAPMGRAMLYIIMVFAQLERETIAERIRDNYQQRSRRGEWAGGSAPFGFDLGRITEETGKKSPSLVPNRQYEIVTRIFKAYSLAGHSIEHRRKRAQ